MVPADKTYSFRAPSELGARIRDARAGFEAATHDAELSAHLGSEFTLALLRRLRAHDDRLRDGVFIRAIVEAFVSAAGRVRDEEQQMQRFGAFEHEDADGEIWRASAVRATAQQIAAEGD
jgi:hypothetical protein